MTTKQLTREELLADIEHCKATFTEHDISKHANEVLMYMLRKYQFYAEVIMQAQVTAKVDLPGPAAMTVNKAVALFMFGPTFMTVRYSFKNRMAIAIHEVEHFMRLHASRRKNKQAYLWNVACDITINQLIEDLPVDALHPEMYKLPEGKTEEQYYNLLLDVQKEQQEEQNDNNNDQSGTSGEEESSDGEPQGDGESSQETSGTDEEKDGGSGSGDGTDQEGSANGNSKDNEGTDAKGRPWLPVKDNHPHWEEINQNANGTIQQAVAAELVNRAIKASKGQGLLPSHIEELAAWLNEPPKINWKHELKQYMSVALKGKYGQTWSRMNRRGMPMVRGKHRKNGKKIVLALDTSGSMSSKVLNEMINELRHMRKMKAADIWMVMCDAEIAWEGKIESFSKLPDRFYGRGGTAFEPVFDWIEEKAINPDVLIYLTDGAGSYPSTPPTYATIWLMTDGCSPYVDWGKVINYPDSPDEL